MDSYHGRKGFALKCSSEPMSLHLQAQYASWDLLGLGGRTEERRGQVGSHIGLDSITTTTPSFQVWGWRTLHPVFDILKHSDSDQNKALAPFQTIAYNINPLFQKVKGEGGRRGKTTSLPWPTDWFTFYLNLLLFSTTNIF